MTLHIIPETPYMYFACEDHESLAFPDWEITYSPSTEDWEAMNRTDLFETFRAPSLPSIIEQLRKWLYLKGEGKVEVEFHKRKIENR